MAGPDDRLQLIVQCISSHYPDFTHTHFSYSRMYTFLFPFNPSFCQFFVLLVFVLVLEIKPGALPVLTQHAITELQPQLSVSFFFLTELHPPSSRGSISIFSH